MRPSTTPAERAARSARSLSATRGRYAPIGRRRRRGAAAPRPVFNQMFAWRTLGEVERVFAAASGPISIKCARRRTSEGRFRRRIGGRRMSLLLRFRTRTFERRCPAPARRTRGREAESSPPRRRDERGAERRRAARRAAAPNEGLASGERPAAPQRAKGGERAAATPPTKNRTGEPRRTPQQVPGSAGRGPAPVQWTISSRRPAASEAALCRRALWARTWRRPRTPTSSPTRASSGAERPSPGARRSARWWPREP
jgi:hypothetical protein